MANDYDGDIKLSVALDPNDVTQSAKKMSDNIARVFDKAAGGQFNASVQSILASLDKLNSKLLSTTNKLIEMENTKIETEDYTRARQDVESLEKQLTKTLKTIHMTREELNEVGGGSEKYQQLETQLKKLEDQYTQLYLQAKKDGQLDWFRDKSAEAINLRAAIDRVRTQMQLLDRAGAEDLLDPAIQNAVNLRDKLDEAKQKLADLETSDKAHTTAASTDQYSQLSVKLSEMVNSTNLLMQKLAELAPALSEEAQEAQQAAANMNSLSENKRKVTQENKGVQESAKKTGSVLQDVNKRVSSLTKKMREVIKVGAQRGIANIRQHFQDLGKGADNAVPSMKKLARTFIKYGLGVRSFFFLYRKIRAAIAEGFPEIAQAYEPFNTVMSNMKTSMAQLKGQLSAMFASLAMMVVPILTAIINKVTEVIQKITQLVGALSGQTTFLKATKVQQNYAGSLAKTADQAEETKKQLMGFDDVNILSENKTKDSNAGADGGGSGFGVETAPIESRFQELAGKLRDYFEEIWEVSKQAWKNKGQKVIDAFNRAFEGIKTVILDIATAFKNVWTDGTGLAFLESVLGLIESTLNNLGAFAEAFDEAWNRGSNGEELIRGYLDMFTDINNLLADITDSFAAAWESETGVSIIEHILNIFTDIYNTVGNIATAFDEAWESAGLGDSIVQHIFDLLDNVLEHINNITSATEEWAANLDFTPLLQAIDDLLANIQPIVDTVGGALEALWNNVLLPLGSWVIQEAVPAALSAIAGAFEILSPIIDGIAEGLKLVWDNFLGPVVNWVGDTVVEFLQKFREFADKIAQNEKAVEVLKSIGTAIGIIVGVVIAVTAAIGAFNIVAGIAGGILAVLTSPITLVIAGITALVAAIVLAVKHWDEIKAKMLEWWDAIKQAFSGIGDWFTEKFQAVKDGIINGFKAVGEWFGNIKQWIKENIVDKFINGIKSLFGIQSPSTKMAEIGGFLAKGLLNGIVNIFKNIGSWIKNNIFDKFKGGLNTVFGIASGVAKKVVDVGKSIVGGIKEGASNSKLWQGIKSIFSKNSKDNIENEVGNKDWSKTGQNVTSGLQKGLSANALWSNITRTFKNGVTNIQSIMKNVDWKGLGTRVTDTIKGGLANSGVWNKIKSTFTTGVNTIKTTFSRENWNNVGSRVTNNIASGISSASGRVRNAVSSTVNNAVNAASYTFREFETIGWNMMTGLANGIYRNANSAYNAITSVSNNVINRARAIPMVASPSKVFRDEIGAMLTLGLAKGIEDEEPAALKAMQKVSEAITNTNFQIPDIALGKVTPYGGGDNNLGKLANAIESMNSGDNVTNATLLAMMQDVIDAVNRVQFYIGDEQVARHAQTGNQKLNRRFSTIAASEV